MKTVIPLAGLSVILAACTPRAARDQLAPLTPWNDAVLLDGSLRYEGTVAHLGTRALRVRRPDRWNLIVRDTAVFTPPLPGLPAVSEMVLVLKADRHANRYLLTFRLTGTGLCVTRAPVFRDGDGVLRGVAPLVLPDARINTRAEIAFDAATREGTWRMHTGDGRVDFLFRFRGVRPSDAAPPAMSQPAAPWADDLEPHCNPLEH